MSLSKGMKKIIKIKVLRDTIDNLNLYYCKQEELNEFIKNDIEDILDDMKAIIDEKQKNRLIFDLSVYIGMFIS